MTFRVLLTREAEADLERLFDVVLERELARDGGDLELAGEAIVAIRAGVMTLKTSPFTCRKAGPSPFLRELIIPFGDSGCVALFEIVGTSDERVVRAVAYGLLPLKEALDRYGLSEEEFEIWRHAVDVTRWKSVRGDGGELAAGSGVFDGDAGGHRSHLHQRIVDGMADFTWASGSSRRE